MVKVASATAPAQDKRDPHHVEARREYYRHEVHVAVKHTITKATTKTTTKVSSKAEAKASQESGKPAMMPKAPPIGRWLKPKTSFSKTESSRFLKKAAQKFLLV